MRSYRRNLAFTIVLSCLFTNLNIAAYAQSLTSADPMPSPVIPFALIPSVRPVQPVVELLKSQPIKTAPTVLTGEVCSERVHALTADMSWFTDLHKAEAQAKAENKLVLWIHMVGKIDGAT